jgi:hypothetical protein
MLTFPGTNSLRFRDGLSCRISRKLGAPGLPDDCEPVEELL